MSNKEPEIKAMEHDISEADVQTAIVMGAGMSLVMTDIGAMLGLADTMVPGIAIGIVGMVMALFTYPIHKRMLASRRKKYAPEIIRLSESIMKS